MLIEHTDDWQHKRELFSPLLQKLMAYAERKSASDLVDAVRVLDQAQVQLQQWLVECDVLVMPTTLQRAFSFDAATPANQADLTGYANFAGNPALSVPLMVAAGDLPLGLQLVGDIGAEMQLIALAETFQQAIGWQPSLPQACNAWWPQ